MRHRIILLLLLIGSITTLLVAPLLGSERIPWAAVWQPAPDDPSSVIFWSIRLPRACLAWISGAGLAMGGMIFQAIFRNPLAEPFTLGISSGAALGATLAMRLGLGLSFLGFSGAALGGMGGALAAIGIVYALTRLRPGLTTSTMLLAGVAVNFFFSSLILMVQHTANFYDSFRILRWMMGGLQMVGFDASLHILPVTLAVAGIAWWLTSELNLLTLGDEWAVSRGVAATRVKTILFFSVSLMVGAIVSLCGPIGFIGLMCPHICRLLVGPNHRRLLPASLLFGGAFLVACDTVARTAMAPAELPVGIFTSFLGGPFFIWLLLRPSREGEMIG
ncbi:TPA: iron ABC transporter [Candidatus Sumerlaeota bacterium]|jgi:iron complex transport system permease protein|nr:iron ABC transporter [Candidatus Sumerlaeota bacterium]